MMEAFRKYFLTLCILLLSGYSCLCSNFHQHRVHYSAIKRAKHLEYSQSDYAVSNQSPRVRYTTPDTKTSNRIYSENKKEENYSFSSLRKYLEISNYFTSFYTRASGRFLHFKKIRIPYSEFYYHSAFDKYILLRVLKIWLAFGIPSSNKIFNKI